VRRRRTVSRKPAKMQQRKPARPRRRDARQAARGPKGGRSTELIEAREQQAATAEVLRIIASSPGDLQRVFHAILANSVRLCEAKFGTLFRCEGTTLRWAAGFGTPTNIATYYASRGLFEPTHGTHLDRVVRTKRVSHSADYPNTVLGGLTKLGGARSIVVVPMLKEDALLGAIGIYRQEARSFTVKQIELVQNFANQAVIAIENARLLNELRQRTTDLSESLERQTATSEVLQVISSSPGELMPVFETMLENATRICEANFGNMYLCEGDALRLAAVHNTPPALVEERKRSYRPGPKAPGSRMARTKQVVHVADLMAEEAYAEGDPAAVAAVELGGIRTLLVVPMLKENELIGALSIYRQEVRPFTDKQVGLLTSFASQAVIAIENTRLLNELRESLQQQTATADVLKVISRSTFDLKAVLTTLVESAARLCNAPMSGITTVVVVA
jgi:GAF domain-containing protein